MRMFPLYMAMGMSYEEYWHGPVWLAKAYREAFEIKRKRDEWARWRQGAYVFEAILCAAPVIKPFVKDAKPGQYPDEPWPLTEEEAREQEERARKNAYQKMREKLFSEAKAGRERRKEAAKKQEVKGNGDD